MPRLGRPDADINSAGAANGSMHQRAGRIREASATEAEMRMIASRPLRPTETGQTTIRHD